MAYESAFHARMAALNETWKWKEWAGIASPCRYVDNHVYEYTAFRQSCGLIDVSPLYKYDLTGRDAGAFLSRATTKNVAKMKPGRVAYTVWCDDDGKTVDDGTVSRLDEGTYRVTAAEPSYRWFAQLARGLDVDITDVSRAIAAVALQGPTSRAVLDECTNGDVTDISFFGTKATKIAGKDVRVSRTGYTGDLGYEVWCAWDDALAVWDEIVRVGPRFDLVVAGLDALDMARIEAGFIMLGVDYFSSPHVTLAQKKSSPYEIGLGWTVDLERDAFVGQDALRREKERGCKRTLVGLELDWDEVVSLYDSYGMAPAISNMASRESLPIYAHGEQVGRVSSSSWSPTLKKYLALATVQSDAVAANAPLQVEHTVMFERRTITGRVVERPFFNPLRKRKP